MKALLLKEKAALVMVMALCGHSVEAWSVWDIFGQSFTSKLITACEQTLKERLKSPATYKRVEVSDLDQRDATLDECMGWETPSLKKDALARDARLRKTHPELTNELERVSKTRKDICNFKTYTHSQLILTYDASNSFGTPIRGKAICSVVTDNPDELSDFNMNFDMRVNGLNNFEWRLH